MTVRISSKPSDVEFGLEVLPNAGDVKKLSQKIKNLEKALKKSDAEFDKLWKKAKTNAPNPRFSHQHIKHVNVGEVGVILGGVKNCKISLEKYKQRLDDYKAVLEAQNTPIPEKKLKKIKSNLDRIERLFKEAEKKGEGMINTQLLVYLSIFFEQFARMLAEVVDGMRRISQMR